VDGRQGQGIVEEDSKGSQGSQRAVKLMMMMTHIHLFKPSCCIVMYEKLRDRLEDYVFQALSDVTSTG
jgi:hypothetical protein